MLPLEVIEKVQSELTNYAGSGMSVMELSHRSKPYEKIHNEAKENLRALMEIPDDYEILFLQGGATMQFSAVPLNLKKTGKADYAVSGSWAKKAYNEAKKFVDAEAIASSEADNYDHIPRFSSEDVRPDADYVHITGNNTIYGTQYHFVPETGGVPLVCDLSSGILSKREDVSRFALIYAGAQKNIAPAGLTVVIIRRELLERENPNVPVYLNYKIHADANSLYNTPPAFAIYFAGEVFKLLIERGGIAEQEKLNRKKAALLYDFIDDSKLFFSPVKKEDRSLMNVVFVTGDGALDKKFIALAEEEGLSGLGGHRSIGGMRASIYNAMPTEGVEKLTQLMEKFEDRLLRGSAAHGDCVPYDAKENL
jgi:phosphoserine aminotransferase